MERKSRPTQAPNVDPTELGRAKEFGSMQKRDSRIDIRRDPRSEPESVDAKLGVEVHRGT